MHKSVSRRFSYPYMSVLRYIIVLFACSHAVCMAANVQSTAFGVQIREYGLRSKFERTSSGRIVVRHPASAAHRDLEKKRDVLQYQFFAPSEGDVRLVVQPVNIQRSVSLYHSGTYDGMSVMTLEIDVVGEDTDESRRLDSFSIAISWDQALVRSAYCRPPSSAPFLNPTWKPRSRVSRSKHVETTQVTVDPSSWYSRFAEYKKIQTSRDGIACVLGSQLLGSKPSAPFTSVVIYWRGVEQPIHIVDVDSSGELTPQDRLYFIGRRPQGDSTWYDVHDSTAVFYATVNGAPGERKRFGTMSEPTVVTDTVSSVFVSKHVELDTGYYHPGSGIDDDHSIFESADVFLEGFYWKSLYGRSKEHARFTTRFAPADTGTVTWTTEFVTTTANAQYAPEHIVSIWNPAQQTPDVRVVDGYQRVRHAWTHSAQDVPPGTQDVIVEATGSDELRSKSNWYSEVLINAIDVEGDALPLLDSGRLHCKVTTSSSSYVLLRNVAPGPVVVIDTARMLLKFVEQSKPGYTVQSGLCPAVAPAGTWDGITYDATVTIASATLRIDSMRSSYAMIHVDHLTGVTRVQRDQRSTDIRDLLTKTSPNDLVVIVSVNSSADETVLSELRKRGVSEADVSIGGAWVAALAEGTGSIRAKNGLIAHIPSLYGTDASASFALEQGRHELYIADSRGVEFARVTAAKNQGISADTAFGDVIAISHANYLQEASRWAQHRYQYSGKTVKLYDIDAVCEEFDAGRRGPNAIRAFLARAFAKSSKKPTHCVLIGNASWDSRLAIRGGNVGARRIDQVPTYGKPSTDMWFGLLDDENDLATPELIVTRFPVSTPTECKGLVDKIITADTTAYTPKMRKFLFVGGGTVNENFCDLYRRMLDDSFGSNIIFTGPPLCIDTVTVCNTDYAAPGLQIRQKINLGVAWMNYIGHGGTDVFDIKDWDPQDLNNVHTYPVLATFSCLTGNYSSPSSLCENAAYLVEPDRGMVAAMGSTGYQYLAVVDLLHYRFHEAMLSKGLRGVGELTYEAKRAFSTMNNQLGRNAALQYCILGDPFTRLRIDTVADLQVYDSNIEVRGGKEQSAVYVQQDSFTVSVNLWNAGTATVDPIDVVIRRFLPNADTAYDSVMVSLADGLCSSAPIAAQFAPVSVGRQRIQVVIDPKRYTKDNTSNNEAWCLFDVFNRSLMIVDPDEYGVVALQSPRFRLLYPYLRTDTTTEQVALSLHKSKQQAIRGDEFSYGTVSRVDNGSFVDYTFMPTSAQISSIDTNAVYWLKATSATSDVVIRPFGFRLNGTAGEMHVVPASADLVASDSVKYDSVSRTLKLSSRLIQISLQSSGASTSDPVRIPSMRIAFGDTVVQSSFRNGINIFVLRPFSTKPKVIRRYDTSPTPAPIETGHYGGASECIAFLRDSILEHEIVAIAACNESFTQFERAGLMPDLRRILKSFGSVLSDSLGIGSSYAFVGSQDTTVSTYESIKSAKTGELVRIDTSIAIRYASALIGQQSIERPRIMKRVTINQTGMQYARLKVFGYESDEPLLDSTRADWTAPRNSSTIRRIDIGLQLVANDEYPDPRCSSLVMHYEPAPMLYVDSLSIRIAPETSLRGDSVTVSYDVRNLHFRHSSPDVLLSAFANGPDDTLKKQSVQLNTVAIGPDKVQRVSSRFYNDPSWYQIAFGCDVTLPSRAISLFTPFQSAARTYQPGVDSTAPKALVVVNDLLVDGDSYVDSMPQISVRIVDASRLPIKTDDNLVVFVNGVRIRPTSAKDYSFFDSEKCALMFPDENVRAAVTFRYPMETGENLLIARVTDANGNKDTSEIFLTYSSVASVGVRSFGPNPAVDNVTFTTEVTGQSAVQPALLVVSDVQGREVSRSVVQLQTGVSSFTWVAKSASDSALAPGVYYWTLQIGERSDVPVENRSSGMVIILR